MSDGDLAIRTRYGNRCGTRVRDISFDKVKIKARDLLLAGGA